MNKINRRNFIKKTSLSGAAIATASALSSSKYKERDKLSQYMGDFFNAIHAVELQNIISDDGRAVGPLAAPSKTRVGLDVDRLLRYRQRRA